MCLRYGDKSSDSFVLNFALSLGVKEFRKSTKYLVVDINEVFKF